MIKLKKNDDDTDQSVFSIFENGKSLFSKGQLFEGYIYIRENINRSEINNDEIIGVLKGEYSVLFSKEEQFEVIAKKNLVQFQSVQQLKNKYESLLYINKEYYSVVKTMNLDFFESVSPRKFPENTLFNTSNLKNFMFDIQGSSFIIFGDTVQFLEKEEITSFNPFIKNNEMWLKSKILVVLYENHYILTCIYFIKVIV